MAEITRKSVLTECLEYERGLWKLCSRKYDTLVPMEGMEDKWDEQREKCRILEDLIHAYDSKPVQDALANWQKRIMKEDKEGKEHRLTI